MCDTDAEGRHWKQDSRRSMGARCVIHQISQQSALANKETSERKTNTSKIFSQEVRANGKPRNLGYATLASCPPYEPRQ